MNTIGGGLLGALVLIMVFTVPLTLNLVIHGADAVIDITPRDAVDRVFFPALWPCVTGWCLIILLGWGMAKSRGRNRP